MARMELMGEEALMSPQNTGGDLFFRLGMMYATGRSGGPDKVAAHKWFNLAALKGNCAARRYRQEIAGEMSEAEIAEAQRQAREWLSVH
jgi:TPR repeat protein